jgi:tetratricopeptide (TPR) repeat protein
MDMFFTIKPCYRGRRNLLILIFISVYRSQIMYVYIHNDAFLKCIDKLPDGYKIGPLSDLLALTKDTEILKKRFQAFLDVIKGFPNGDRYYFIIKLLYSLEEMGLIEEHFSKVLETVSQIQFPTHNDDWYWIASLFIRIAEIHRDRNEFSSALRRVSDALKIYNKLGNNFRSLRDTAICLGSAGHIFEAMKDPDQAKKYFRMSVNMLEKLGLTNSENYKQFSSKL